MITATFCILLKVNSLSVFFDRMISSLNFTPNAKNGAKPPTKNGDTRSLFYHPVLFGGKDTIFSVLNCHN